MREYRVPELDLATRVQIAASMMMPGRARGWGLVTRWAENYGVSRQLLYKIRDRAESAVLEALAPTAPGPKPLDKGLLVDQALIKRTIAVMPLLTGSVRSIQTGLELLFGVERSTGYISQKLQEAGAAAAAENEKLQPSMPILAEADEIFQGGMPCLTVVDGGSFLVLNLMSADSRDAETWGLTFLELAERGIPFWDVVSDGAKGIHAGVAAAELDAPLRPDLFHLWRETYTIGQRLERRAYKAMETAERADRAAVEATSAKKRPGRKLKVDLPPDQAHHQAQEAIDRCDGWQWLTQEIRQNLEPITSDGRLADVTQVQETIDVAMTLMLELADNDISAFVQTLQGQMHDLLAPLVGLTSDLAPVRAQLEPADEAFILWAWRHRHELDLDIERDFSSKLQPVVRHFYPLLALFHRASSLAESLHSWLRPYLQIHRGMPQWLLPLLQLFWNHHSFQRGKRAGNSPLELAGISDAASLKQLFDRLFPLEPAYSLAC